MAHRMSARIVLSLFALTLAGVGGASVSARSTGEATITAATRAEAASEQSKGRYKKQGDDCLWDAEDSGPNQCTPRTAGRFKKSGDACVWDANDKGADQCQPPKGRFKQDGSRCYFDANDSGPNQCNPRQPR